MIDAAAHPRSLAQAAEALCRAESRRSPIAPLSRGMPSLRMDEAYEIAAMVRAMNGSSGIGFKLGYTSAAMRAQMGINEPNFGVLRQGSQIRDPGDIPMDDLIHPLVEPEISFLMAEGLAGHDIGRDDAWNAIGAVFASIEIVDSRYENYKFAAVDNIADNSSAARFVLGERVSRDCCPDLRAVPVRLLRNGETVGTGTGNDAMGDPVAALIWLAGALAEKGSGITAGDLVMTGGLTRAHPVDAGSEYSAIFEGLGTVTARFQRQAIQ